MDSKFQQFVRFLDQSHSNYHATANLVQQLQAAGYQCLQESQAWNLVPGGKYYMTRGGSSVIAFRIPEQTAKGFLMSASHTDRPGFKIKENGELTGAYTRFTTEKYGSVLMGTWLDRPLSVAGRVVVETENGLQTRLIDIDKDLFLIPHVAIHMNRQANDGIAWNPTVDTLPLFGTADAAGKFSEMLQQAAGGKILAHDLWLYVRQKATVWGTQEEFISSAALDDLQCAWGCTQGFLEAETATHVPVLCVFDSEEIGSFTKQGADSGLLPGVLGRICDSMHYDLQQMLSQSFMISADNAHAVHPNHPEYADATNAPVVGGGIVIKFNAAQRYTTDGVSAAIFRKVCKDAGVPVQNYYNRADLAGGTTLGCVSVTQVSVPSVDIGLPQLAMHSCYETAGTQDTLSLVAAMRKYYQMQLQTHADGSYFIA